MSASIKIGGIRSSTLSNKKLELRFLNFTFTSIGAAHIICQKRSGHFCYTYTQLSHITNFGVH